MKAARLGGREMVIASAVAIHFKVSRDGHRRRRHRTWSALPRATTTQRHVRIRSRLLEPADRDSVGRADAPQQARPRSGGSTTACGSPVATYQTFPASHPNEPVRRGTIVEARATGAVVVEG